MTHKHYKPSVLFLSLLSFTVAPLVAMELPQPQDAQKVVRQRKPKKDAVVQEQAQNLEQKIEQKEPAVDAQELAQIEQEVQEALTESMIAERNAAPTQHEEQATSPEQEITLPRAQQKESVSGSPSTLTKLSYALSSNIEFVNGYYFTRETISEDSVVNLIKSLNKAIIEAKTQLPTAHHDSLNVQRKLFKAAQKEIPSKIEYKPMEGTLEFLTGMIKVPVEGNVRLRPDESCLEILLQKLKKIDTNENKYVQETLNDIQAMQKQLVEASKHNRNQRKQAMRIIKSLLTTSTDSGEISEDDEDVQELQNKIMAIRFEEKTA